MIKNNRLFNGRLARFIKRFIDDESAVGVVELILILVVLIGLVVIFRDQLTTIIGDIFGRIATDSAAI